MSDEETTTFDSESVQISQHLESSENSCDKIIPGVNAPVALEDIVDSSLEERIVDSNDASLLAEYETAKDSIQNHNDLPNGISNPICPEPQSSSVAGEPHEPSSSLSLFGWSPRLLFAVFMVLISCCCNVIFLELLVRQDPGIGNLVTFSQFLVIALEGFIFTTKCGTVGPQVPFSSWIVLVVMYFLVSVTNNYALSYHVPMPLHMIFRAGSLLANMLMGMVLLGKRYKTVKYVSVLIITVGIATCTVMSATSRVSLKSGKAVFSEEGESKQAVEEILAALELEQTERLRELSMGIALLVLAMLMSARMGIYQEVLYTRHGKHPKEALFYTHALPLPGFLLLAPDIMHHWQVCSLLLPPYLFIYTLTLLQICMSSAPVTLPLLSLELPSMILHLICNVVPQVMLLLLLLLILLLFFMGVLRNFELSTLQFFMNEIEIKIHGIS